MQPIERALLSLEGLSVADALGERFFGEPTDYIPAMTWRKIPEGSWRYTDDTEMALSIVESLLEDGGIDPDALAKRFAARYDHKRGYGGGAHILLNQLRAGHRWDQVAPQMFGGTGSFGNGSAMRIPPLGAYFADALETVREHARRSALPTHTNPEGIAGAVATAIMAALAWRVGDGWKTTPSEMIEEVLRYTPESLVRQNIETTLRFDLRDGSEKVAEWVGSGQRISCQDTVPLCIWCAAHYLHSYEEAFWATVRCLGDRDTTCAIVGGIVILADRKGLPDEWRRRREPLPADIYDIQYAVPIRP